jgi:hypothetical protein
MNQDHPRNKKIEKLGSAILKNKLLKEV